MAAGLTLQAPGLSPLDLMTLATPAAGGSAAAAASGTKARAHAAAQNFESVFLNTMFEQMYTGIDGEGPFGGSGATGVWRSLLTDTYAKSFAKAGGIGLANHVYQQLLAMQEQHS